MSLSHISNCGVGSCYLVDAEQLHVDGNKSLIYSMINFTLKPEDTTFRVPGSVAYVRSPKVLRNAGTPTQPPPGAGLPPQAPIIERGARRGERLHVRVRRSRARRRRLRTAASRARSPSANVGGVGQLGDDRPDPRALPLRRGGSGAGDRLRRRRATTGRRSTATSTRTTRTSRPGRRCTATCRCPGRYRICMTGGLATKLARPAASADLDITFSEREGVGGPGPAAVRRRRT